MKRTNRQMIDELRACARKYGWAIGEHGSMERDVDLILVPWSEAAIPAKELATVFLTECTLQPHGDISQRPYGRQSQLFLQPGSKYWFQHHDGPDKGQWSPMCIDISFVGGPK